jgi:hypothetical protein
MPLVALSVAVLMPATFTPSTTNNMSTGLMNTLRDRHAPFCCISEQLHNLNTSLITHRREVAGEHAD